MTRGNDSAEINDSLNFVGNRGSRKLFGKHLFFVDKVFHQVERVQHVVSNIYRLESFIKRSNIVGIALDNFDF